MKDRRTPEPPQPATLIAPIIVAANLVLWNLTFWAGRTDHAKHLSPARQITQLLSMTTLITVGIQVLALLVLMFLPGRRSQRRRDAIYGLAIIFTLVIAILSYWTYIG